MREKEPIAANSDYGKDEDSAEALLKKHDAFMSDLEAYRTVVEGLREQAQACNVSKVKCRFSRATVSSTAVQPPFDTTPPDHWANL